jgi:PAS domain S-box-containing protein
MTKSEISENIRSKTAHKALRKKVDRIAGGEAVGLTEEEQLDLLRLAHELELVQVELEIQNEELQKTSRDLEAARFEFWDLYESAPVAYVSLSKKGIVEKANAAARQMLSGRSDGHLIGQAFSNFVMPEDMSRYFQDMKKITRNEKPVFFELQFVDAAGRSIPVYCQASTKFDPQGGLISWNLAFFDISEQRRLEEALRISRENLAMATQAGGIGIWIVDLKTGKSHWNAPLYRMLGLAPRSGPEDQQEFFKFIHPDDRQGVLENAQNVATLEHKIDLEFRIIRADDGSTRWLAARGSIDRDDSGRPVQLRGVNFDITDRKQAEETLRLAQFQLAEQLVETRQINEELSQYAYAVTHDLKAPLRAIRNYADFLYEDLADTLTGDQKEYLKGLKRAVDQGDALISDLLNFSRIGRVALVKQAADVPGIVHEIRSLLDLPPGVEIEVQPQWPEVWADHTLLKQILQNLIVNGIKFNQRKLKRIEIGWQPGPDARLEIFVRDNGIGIKPEYRDQVFKIFRRLHTDSEYEGTGIGLAIVQKAAQKLGGSVRLESTAGEGSTFYVNLPNSK